MNIEMLFFMLARLLFASGLALIPSLMLAFFYNEPSTPYFVTIGISLLLFLFCYKNGHESVEISTREGIAITSFGWIVISLLYAIPYTFFSISFLDSLVESVSGLTGTGATIINNVEAMPQSLLFFRSMTHWIGGLGIIVFFIALFPQFQKGTARMLYTESSGPVSSTAMPRIKEMTKALFIIYTIATLLSTAVYMVLGLDFLTALNHAFSATSTGGFSTNNGSIAEFKNPILETAIAIFMAISAINFSVYVIAWKKGWKTIFKDTEFKGYLAMLAFGTLIMAINLNMQADIPFMQALHDTFFTASSLSSTTGFVTVDFDTWPTFSKWICLMLMFVGGSGGSTSGGFKIIRLIILLKGVYALIRYKLNPKFTMHLHTNTENYDNTVLLDVFRYFFVYSILCVIFMLIFLFDGVATPDAIGLSITTMSGTGPSFGQFGPTMNYAALPTLSKIAVCFSMLIGRLEAFPLIILFYPTFWRKSGW